MSAKPALITFTGADDQTDVRRMQKLAERYPIEWAVLFSADRQGEGRYPSLRFLHALLDAPWLNLYPRQPGDAGGMHFAAHLCGSYARIAAAGEPLPVEIAGLVHRCDRAQINLGGRKLDVPVVAEWGRCMCTDVILQCREFPDDGRVSWLHDLSGGRGKAPVSWPVPPINAMGGAVMVGYAGGMNPQNVAGHVEMIGEMCSSYWIDMESGVRDAQDGFDLDRCEAVCKAVYGP